jgi:transposase InsO family protein
MSARLEFVLLAKAPGANIRALCRAYGISPKTGYKYLARYEQEGESGLQDQSRRPHCSPRRSAAALEAQVIALHETHPCWGARKLRALLPEPVTPPHHSTVDAILKRHGRQVQGAAVEPDPARHRFEHPAPNMLWQMDFKGHFPLTDRRAGRCHPLTVLDDHSRFNVCLVACGNETRATVQPALEKAFRRYGLPNRITADNGKPWGTSGRGGLSGLAVWLIRLGIRIGHSRPYHPQTQGKDERFHRTLKLEVINRTGFHSLAACQSAFDAWRDTYNLLRPHEALGQKPPISRYQSSARAFPERLPAIEYPTEDHVLKVRPHGYIAYQKHEIFVGEGLAGEYVAVRPSEIDGRFNVFFCHKKICDIDLRNIA